MSIILLKMRQGSCGTLKHCLNEIQICFKGLQAMRPGHKDKHKTPVSMATNTSHRLIKDGRRSSEKRIQLVKSKWNKSESMCNSRVIHNGTCSMQHSYGVIDSVNGFCECIAATIIFPLGHNILTTMSKHLCLCV